MADLIEVRRRILTQTPHLETASGQIVTFNTSIAAPLKSLRASLTPQQSDNDDISPFDARPITGWTGLNIHMLTSSDLVTEPVSWASEVGTIYGGVVDLVNGVITQTFGELIYTGQDNEDWHIENGDNFYIMTPPEFYRGTNSVILYCNRANSRTTLASGSCRITATGNFNIKIGRIIGVNTVSGFKAWLADHPLQVVAKYQTPILRHFTEAPIKLLRGVNTLWASNNGNISVDYWTHYYNPQQKTIGGIAVWRDNCAVIGNGTLAAVSDNPDFFLALVDTGTSGQKAYAMFRQYVSSVESGKWFAARFYDDLTASSVDYRSAWANNPSYVAVDYTFSSYGRYIVASVCKQYAADFYVRYQNGAYLIRGNNVT